MRKHIVYILVLITCTLSCTTKDNKIKLGDCIIQNYCDTVSTIPSPENDIDLPDGLSYGNYKNRNSGEVKEDRNLLSQYSTYVQALLLGDINACKKYLYRDAFEYHKKEFPLLSEKDIWSQYFKNISKAKLLSDYAARSNMDVAAVIPLFDKKIVCNEIIIVSFKSSIQFNSRKYYIKYDILEDCIAFSDTGGKHWEFITVNEDTHGILSLKFSRDVILELMGNDSKK